MQPNRVYTRIVVAQNVRFKKDLIHAHHSCYCYLTFFFFFYRKDKNTIEETIPTVTEKKDLEIIEYIDYVAARIFRNIRLSKFLR